MKFDDILTKHVGECGRYQRQIIAILCIREIFTALHTMGVVFLAASPNFWCENKLVDLNPNLNNCTAEQRSNLTSPWTTDGKGIDSCMIYERNASELVSCDFTTTTIDPWRNVTTDCPAWRYDTTQHANTLTSEFNLVCGDSWIKSLIASVFLGGIGVGGFLFAWFSDRYGRKKIIVICELCSIVCAFVCTFAPNVVVYLVMRFLLGAFLMGSSTAFVYASEMVGPSRRVVVGVIQASAWSSGYMALSGIAYLMRHHDWRHISLVFTAPQIIFVVTFALFVPESPRWLYLKGRAKEANEIVKRMAETNGMQLPDKLDIIEQREGDSNTTTLDLLKTPNIRALSLIMVLNWAANGFIYYGFALNTSSLKGNPYINAFMSAGVEIPAYVFMLWAIGRFGRIKVYVYSIVGGGLALFITIAIPEDYQTATIVLSMAGKFFITETFFMLWIYSSEAYPTSIRNQGLFTTALGARVASFLSPYVWLLSDTHRSLPSVLYGISAIIAGLLFAFLPETKGRPLPQTVEEGEAVIPRNRVHWSCRSSNEEDKHSAEGNAML